VGVTIESYVKLEISYKHISITPPSFMKFCSVVPEICRGQVHGARKERRITRIKRIRIIIIIGVQKGWGLL
jgi:hypothetical protein